MSTSQQRLGCIDTKTLNVTLGDTSATETIRGVLLDFAAAVVRDIVGAGRTLLAWRRRASQRRQLAVVDARLLRDMGISREDALAEARKPFWQA